VKKFAEALESARKLAVPAIYSTQESGDPKHNFGDWLSHAILACTGKAKEAANAADHLEKNYKQLDIQTKSALGESSGVTGVTRRLNRLKGTASVRSSRSVLNLYTCVRVEPVEPQGLFLPRKPPVSRQSAGVGKSTAARSESISFSAE
jgi:hypothetical protein